MKHKSNPNPLPTTIDPDSPTATEIRDTREDQFLALLFDGLPISTAAQQAGYSDSYSKVGIYSKFRSPEFQVRLRDYAIAVNAKSIPKVVNLYGLAIDQLQASVASGNLDQLSKLKHIPKHVLEIGKILSPDQVSTINYINIESLQAVIGSKMVKGNVGSE